MITINTQRIDDKMQDAFNRLQRIQNFRNQRLNTLSDATGLLEQFVAEVGCKDLLIDNMYSTGFDDSNSYQEDSQLLCYATMQYKKTAPKNAKLFAKKLDDKFQAIVKDKEQRLCGSFYTYKVKNDGVKFEIRIKK